MTETEPASAAPAFGGLWALGRCARDLTQAGAASHAQAPVLHPGLMSNVAPGGASRLHTRPLLNCLPRRHALPHLLGPPSAHPFRQMVEQDAKVHLVLRVMGLSHAADTLVGDNLLRGVSGG